ncbi:DUF1887 family protein [Peteryoungia desertarenae]|uniref:DUF1887 family protein n=1 Tax=Peteryoungia desertarenae TaxID=1813451 RepID=A0ABX6QHY4_9HYPH|nr:DUF1887 family CARF protein [Peteryoungia desertarenae]QLF68181.1 DUF1887 family protein [Peteryoungia desertarenae]
MFSKLIAGDYSSFEEVRDHLMLRDPIELSATHRAMLESAEHAGLIEKRGLGFTVAANDARRYLTGGWLEEYIGLALSEIGAEEITIGQKIRWQVGEFVGENEIDVMASFGGDIFMCSCKALKSRIVPGDERVRVKLMQALHEADNLADHFNCPGGVVALAVTTDLLDERNRLVHYQQLHGKAAALGVNLIALDDLPWAKLKGRLVGFLGGSKL